MKKLIVLALVLCSSCAWLTTSAKKVEQVTVHCADVAVRQNVVSLLPLVMAVVTGNADNWRQQLEAVAKEFGQDALACTLQAAQDALEESAKVDDAGARKMAAADTSASKTRQFIKEKKYVFAD